MASVKKKYKVTPSLIVFDLDYTLWPLWVDTHVETPFKKLSNGEIVDKYSHKVPLYGDVQEILETLEKDQLKMAVASRTSAISVAEALLNIMNLNRFFTAKEIYPGSKVAHFSKFHQGLCIPYEEMLFFDDEQRNIRDLSKMGVTAILVEDGLSWENLHRGLKEFESRHSRH